MNKKIYVYPKLDSNYDLGYIRIGGSGLANCMFVAARAWIIHKEIESEFIAPTWEKFSIGTYLRKERDKRHYFGLFSKSGISGLKKIYLLMTLNKAKYQKSLNYNANTIITVEGLNNYFKDLLNHHQLVNAYFKQIILKKHLNAIEGHDFSNVIGIHVRLGDFTEDIRISIFWYQKIIKILQRELKNEHKFYIFSDGTDEELRPLTTIENTQRVFFGSALSDILGLSRCQFIIGSHSTFSGWGAYLGQVPIVFNKRNFGRVLINEAHEFINTDADNVSKEFINFFKKLP